MRGAQRRCVGPVRIVDTADGEIPSVFQLQTSAAADSTSLSISLHRREFQSIAELKFRFILGFLQFNSAPLLRHQLWISHKEQFG